MSGVAKGYDIKPHPPPVSQVCLRCGALVGSANIHDEWHDKQKGEQRD